MSKTIRFIAMDPSLANTGFLWGEIINDEPKLLGWEVIQTSKTNNKQIRASSDTVERAKATIEAINRITESVNPTVTFAETPSGSQSSNGMKSYGLSCSYIALLKPSAIQVTPTEVKKATVGKKTASKEEIMSWAEKQHPYFNFERNKTGELIKARMEHICDCIAIVHAGIKTSQYEQIKNFIL